MRIKEVIYKGESYFQVFHVFKLEKEAKEFAKKCERFIPKKLVKSADIPELLAKAEDNDFIASLKKTYEQLGGLTERQYQALKRSLE